MIKRKKLERCEYAVPAKGISIYPEEPCERPAIAQWTLEDGDICFVCEEHDKALKENYSALWEAEQ